MPMRPRTAQTPNIGGCADVLVRIPNLAQGQLRTGTSAHLAGADAGTTRGGARTSSSAVRTWRKANCGRGRPRTSQAPNTGGCADVLVRIPNPGARPIADGDVRAPRRRRTPGGARTSSSASRTWRKVNCGRGRPRTSQTPDIGGARTSSSAFRTWRKANCGRGRPRTSQTPNRTLARGQLRTGTSAHLADAERGCADVLVRIPNLVQGQLRTGTSAHLADAEHWGCADVLVRSPNLAQGQLRTGTSAHLADAEHWGCADVLVRIPNLAKANCGRGRPRTSQAPRPHSGLVPRWYA